MLLATMALHTLVMLIQVFSQSWTMFCALYFVVGLAQISNYVAAFVLGNYVQLIDSQMFLVANLLMMIQNTL